MNQKKKERSDKAKIIHLPQKTIEGLVAMAAKHRMLVKPFMEKVLIDFETKKGKNEVR